MFSKSLCSHMKKNRYYVDYESSSYMTQAGITKVEIAQLKNSTLSRLLTFTKVFNDYQVTIHFHINVCQHIYISQKNTAFTNGTGGYTKTAFCPSTSF